MKKYNPSVIEPKWQKIWKEEGIDKVDLSSSKKPYYLLVEFTYPSGDLHIGHWFSFAVPDILGRMKRMQGYNVFFPNGFDAFGLPAENAAIKHNIHPQDWTLNNIEKMKKQFGLMGAIHDWEHSVVTCMPEYYKWNQWIFLKMLEKGLAYKGKALANWCPNCQTVLANENVEAGKCWRCGTEVIQKEVEQWFLKITDYAERLLWKSDNLSVDWPKPIREGQNNWIGKSEGMEIEFVIASEAKQSSSDKVTVYTVYPETIFGVTYMVLAPEHPLVKKITSKEQKAEVEEYIKISQKKSNLERTSLDKSKTGVFTGAYVINPVNGKKVPVWIADYVLAGYGTGAVMGVPGSDHRDFEFASKYKLEIIRVIGKTASDLAEIKKVDQVLEEGVLVNSEQFNGLSTPKLARDKVKDWMEKQGFGKRKIQYHLHDWSISRQRYWGTPIPIINCLDCGVVPVPEKDLPVELPYEVDYAPKGKAPLATDEAWINVKCPKCGKPAKREAETMDTFVDSSWYFLRYLDPHNDTDLSSLKHLKTWMPVDIYFGGSEHTLGHTLYSRFFFKFLNDLGVLGKLELDEYAQKRVHHGVILGPDGSRMSKSRGNVVNPDIQVKNFGADAVRLYLAFLGPYDVVAPWNPTGIKGVYNYLQRLWSLQDKLINSEAKLSDEDNRRMQHTIRKVSLDVENIKFNTAIASLMEYLNYLIKKPKVSKQEYKVLLLLTSAFAPHITEEVWHNLGLTASIHQQSWPISDKTVSRDKNFSLVVQVNGKVRDLIMIHKDIESNRELIKKQALQSTKVKKFLEGKTVKTTIYVPGKIINFVV